MTRDPALLRAAFRQLARGWLQKKLPKKHISKDKAAKRYGVFVAWFRGDYEPFFRGPVQLLHVPDRWKAAQVGAALLNAFGKDAVYFLAVRVGDVPKLSRVALRERALVRVAAYYLSGIACLVNGETFERCDFETLYSEAKEGAIREFFYTDGDVVVYSASQGYITTISNIYLGRISPTC